MVKVLRGFSINKQRKRKTFLFINFFLSSNNLDFSLFFIVKIATPWKKLPSLFQQPPLKVEVLSNMPTPFVKIWLEVQTPLQQKGGCTLYIFKEQTLVDEEITLMKRKKEMYTKAEEIQDFNLLPKANSFRKQSWKNRKF